MLDKVKSMSRYRPPKGTEPVVRFSVSTPSCSSCTLEKMIPRVAFSLILAFLPCDVLVDHCFGGDHCAGTHMDRFRDDRNAPLVFVDDVFWPDAHPGPLADDGVPR